MTYEDAERWYRQGFINAEEWNATYFAVAQGVRDSMDHALSYALDHEWPNVILEDITRR